MKSNAHDTYMDTDYNIHNDVDYYIMDDDDIHYNHDNHCDYSDDLFDNSFVDFLGDVFDAERTIYL